MSLGLETIDLLILLVLLWLLFSALTSPLEALGWWAGWYGEGVAEALEAEETEAARTEPAASASYFIVFLTGIAGVKSEVYLSEEREFLHRLARRLPEAVIVDDIFPYSVTNRALTGQRLFAWFWRYAFWRKERGGRVGLLINLRNLFQVMVSADQRYGPIYNQGSAALIVKGLQRHGYLNGSGTPVALIGYSGGGQIALGAVTYLARGLAAPIRVISLGGVMGSDPGVTHVEHLYHLRGTRDRVQRLGQLLFPGRWSLFPNSAWNRAVAAGKISVVEMGDIDHNGPGGYLDVDSYLENGQSYMDQTVETIAGLVQTPYESRPMITE